MAIFLPITLILLNLLIAWYMVIDENNQPSIPPGKLGANTIFMYVFGAHVIFLVIGTLCSLAFFIFSIFIWLKKGVWLIFNPINIANFLDDGNVIKELLISNSSWVGIEHLNSWYIQQNIIWTFLPALTMFLLLIINRCKIWNCS